MHPQLQCEPTLYRSHQEILLRSEIVSCPRLRGPVEGMYPIWDQCRAVLRGQEGSAEDPALRRWVYDLTVPVMVVGRDAAQRAEVHLSAALCTPFSEEKMRFGCQLQCSCDLYPPLRGRDGRRAVPLDVRRAHLPLLHGPARGLRLTGRAVCAILVPESRRNGGKAVLSACC